MKKMSAVVASLFVAAVCGFAETDSGDKVFNGKVELKQRVNFKGTSVVNVEKGATVNVNTGATFTADAGSTVTIASGATLAVASGATMTLGSVAPISWWSSTNMLIQAGSATNGQAVTFATKYASTVTPFVFLSWRDTCIAAVTGATLNVGLNAASVASNGFTVASGISIGGEATNVQYLVIGPKP